MVDLEAQTQTHLEKASTAEHGRSAELVVQDGPLRQSVLALAEGAELSEHDAPPAASILVLRGAIDVVAESGTTVLETGMLAEIPHERHSVKAEVDSVFLLTAVTDI
ncbi:hypothetical protein CLV56_2106 [Mumia flava]|uniref:Quercetin dioxygenase-like cupin family protein n=2 Tax=Mumia flava TaxID=1348852 RepID=A0A0B2B329_9ACTN|nr:hypothetical protein CLV56_2106 [Mumia flava]